MIRELKEEIERLKLGGATAGSGDAGGGGQTINDEELRHKMEEQE
jgi:hypothetical protein